MKEHYFHTSIRYPASPATRDQLIYLQVIFNIKLETWKHFQVEAMGNGIWQMSVWWSYCQVRCCWTLHRVDTVQEGNRKCSDFSTVNILWMPNVKNHVRLAGMVDWLDWTDEPMYPQHESFSNITCCTRELKLAFFPPAMEQGKSWQYIYGGNSIFLSTPKHPVPYGRDRLVTRKENRSAHKPIRRFPPRAASFERLLRRTSFQHTGPGAHAGLAAVPRR